MNHMFHILGLQWLSSPLFQSIPHDIPITNGGFLKWCVPRVPRVPQIIQIIQIHVSNLMLLGIPHDFIPYKIQQKPWSLLLKSCKITHVFPPLRHRTPLTRRPPRRDGSHRAMKPLEAWGG